MQPNALCILGCSSDKCQSEAATSSFRCQCHFRSADEGYTDVFLQERAGWSAVWNTKVFLAYSSSFFLAVLGLFIWGGGNVEILSICAELPGVGGLRTWEQPDVEIPKLCLIWHLAPLPSNRGSSLLASASHLPVLAQVFIQPPGESPQGTNQPEIAYVLSSQQG